MNYFFLRQDLFDGATGVEIVGHTASSAAVDWVAGQRFDTPFPHETFQLDDAYGRNLPDFFDTTVPVMSLRLLDQLRATGISNIDAYPVALHNPRTQRTHAGYVAINVVGCVDAVDLSASEHEIRRGKPRFKGSITVDESRTNGLLVFRLPHSPRFIVVTHAVAQALAAANLDSVLLQPTTEYRGV